MNQPVDQDATNDPHDDRLSLSEVTSRLSRLYTAVVCDALDSLGFRQQALTHRIRPVSKATQLIGRARTLNSRAVDYFPQKPYEKELEALDTLTEGDVVVLATNGDLSAAVWGELLSIASMAKGARGAVSDGLTRDAARIREMDFPVFAQGLSSYDSLGRSEVTAYDVRVECDGVVVESGDIVFGDYDGVMIIPRQALAETLVRAEYKVGREGIVEQEFRKGRKIAEVFAEHGIL
jgi:4-hydroxy-4-methyl-2-oxoglutarate aldolase